LKFLPGRTKTVEHTVPQLVVELRAETIGTLDHSAGNDQQSDAAEPTIDEVPLLRDLFSSTAETV
jgi:single-strand DNA-binding protein